MIKEWISSSEGRNLKFKRETLLNYGLNRWGLNKAYSVGPTSELIRTCAPSTFEEWEDFYFTNAQQKKKNGLKVTREYITEIETIYGQLEGAIGRQIEPAPDSWDRTYGVDFSIQIGEQYIGLQIKPISSGQALNQYQWIEMHTQSHKRFERDFGGKVFFIYSIKSSGKKKRIYNVEVIEEIKSEISRLTQNASL